YRNPTFLRVESEFPLLLLYGGNVHGGAYERIKLPADIPEALAQRYKDKTVTFESNWSDAGAVETAFGIARVFGRAGAPLTLQNTQHADAEQWRGHNLIVVSPPWYNQFVKQLPPLRRFEFAESEALVRMKGAGGKLEEFEPEFSPKGEGLRTTWAVVSLAPGFSHGTHFLRISGVHLPATQGAARFITSDEGLRELAQGLGDPSRLPEQFEVLLRVDTLRGQVTRVSFSRGADTTAR
ncbi:MAG: hypothetical protein HY858_05405, partial [Candidatus Solibacter usitatus]|nr:hypothetical protein [Candidatus Solibacter usitatus]